MHVVILLDMCLGHFCNVNWKSSKICGTTTESDGTGLRLAPVTSQKMCITFIVSWVSNHALAGVCACYVYPFPPLCLGEDYRQSIDPDVLAYCMLHCAHNAPPFYPAAFQALADHLLSDLFFTQGQITVHNCKVVYCYMVHELCSLL